MNLVICHYSFSLKASLHSKGTKDSHVSIFRVFLGGKLSRIVSFNTLTVKTLNRAKEYFKGSERVKEGDN